jgi:hypothetical protein
MVLMPGSVLTRGVMKTKSSVYVPRLRDIRSSARLRRLGGPKDGELPVALPSCHFFFIQSFVLSVRVVGVVYKRIELNTSFLGP